MGAGSTRHSPAEMGGGRGVGAARLMLGGVGDEEEEEEGLSSSSSGLSPHVAKGSRGMLFLCG